MARKDLLVADSPEDLTDSMGSWLWLKASTGEIFELSGDTWVLKTGFALISHAHSELTGEFEGEFKKIKIENGIVTEFELD